MLGGSLSALLGVALGHKWDQKAAGASYERVVSSSVRNSGYKPFFMATFSVIGYVAKAAGWASEDEIEAVHTVLTRLGLTP